MSFDALLWATNDAPIADVNEFAVLMILAEKADPDGCNAFPSKATMAGRPHIDQKTVLRTLQRLESRGLIGKGDQSAAAYLRADRRPVVYDLLIPYSWFSNIERINKERIDRGRQPLTREQRPDLHGPPEKKRRSDVGKKRSRDAVAQRGDSESPRSRNVPSTDGVTTSPERGDSQSGAGGLVVTRTSPLNQSTRTSPDAPSARSALGARSASTSGSRRSRGSGSAASSKTTPSPEPHDGSQEPGAPAVKLQKQRGRGHSRQQLEQARAVCALFPAVLGVSLVPVLTDAILGALAGDVPSADRTAEQLGARIEQRWNHHGYASKFHAGELASPVGAAAAMVRPLKPGDRYGCANPRCEDGADVDTGQACTVCPERIADRRAERRQSTPQEPSRTPAPVQRRQAPEPPHDAPQSREKPVLPAQVQPVGDYSQGAGTARALLQGSKAAAHRRNNLLDKAR